MTQFHDNQFLQFLQQGYYAWPWLAGMLVVVLLIGLPGHRRLAQFVAVLTAVWCTVLIVMYGHFRETPLLACLSVAAAAWAVVRRISLTARQAAPPVAVSKLRFPYRVMEGVVRDYFRADPRGVYWLDLARASRGLRPVRSHEDRQSALKCSFELSDTRTFLWRRIVFPLIELRIFVLLRLPSWWHLPAVDLSLNEPYLDLILEEEIAAAEREMMDREAGGSFSEYVQRVARDEHTEALRQAGLFGLKRCCLTEALLESRVFVDELPTRHATLLECTRRSYELWRFRWANDRLWAAEPPTDRSTAEPRTAVVEDVAVKTSSGSETIPAHKSGDESRDAVRAQQPAQTRELVGATTTSDEGPWTGTDDSDVRDTNEWDSSSDELDKEASVEACASDGNDEFEDLSDFTDDEFSGLDDSATSDDEDAEPDQEFTSGRSDAEAFSSVTVNRPDDSGSLESSGRTVFEEARLNDLRLACTYLEAWLGFVPADDFPHDVQSLEEMRHRPVNWLVTTWLLMLMCLRDDCGRGRNDRVKTAVVMRLSNWVGGLASGDKAARDVKRRFQELLVDWLALRGAYTQIRERFSHSTPESPWQWELLGRANANIARQLSDHGDLRDDVLRNATIAFFRAGVTGVWTQRYAGLLLGTSSVEDTIGILQDHPVEFGRSELDRMRDVHARTEPEQEPADELDGFASNEGDGFEIAPPVKNVSAPPSKPDKPARQTSSGTRSRDASGPDTTGGKGKASSAAPKKAKEKPDKASTSSGSSDLAVPQLVMEVQAGDKVKNVPLTRFPVTLGSEADCTIRHSSLQPHHLRLHLKHGRLLIEDLVAGSDSDKGRELPLGRTVKVGKIKFRVKSQ